MQVAAVNGTSPLKIYSQNAQKASFEAYMEQIIEARIEDEKRRKAGGGGGSRRTFDKIKSSIMYSNFLSNKVIQAMLRNFNGLDNLKSNQSSNQIQVPSLAKVATAIFSAVKTFMIPVIQSPFVMQLSSLAKKAGSQMLQFAQTLSLQLNKLKELLEDEIKEKMKLKKLKSKLLKISSVIEEFVISMKEEIKDLIINLINSNSTSVTYQ